MACSLTQEQQHVVSIAESGHNLLLTGKAGTGKSFVVNTIVTKLKAMRRRVVVVCSSGISCTVYDNGAGATTVHSHYGLYTADLPANMVVERSIAMEHSIFRIKSADTVIWDECGMSSQRTLELVNKIHHVLAGENSKNKPFGGKQLILVGDFLQLRPVPNVFDGGRFMFESDLFVIAIPHRFELTRAMRQNNASGRFQTALEDLRMGNCSKANEEYLKSLSRPIEGADVDVVHIFFRKLAVELFNLNVLQFVPGELLTFECEDRNDTGGISCPAPQKLLLKPGVKVMLVWNLSHDQKNGSSGVFLRCLDDTKLEAEISGRVVPLEKVTWFKHNRKGEVVGSRTQFPLALFYASTCHKVQGLTLDKAVVHCCKEFVPGLIYVAASRVKHEDHLQLLNFRCSQLLPPSTEALNVCLNAETTVGDRTCCNQKRLPEQLFEVCDRGELFCDDWDAPESLERDVNPDGLVQSFYEHQDDDIIIDLEEMYGTLQEHEEDLSCLPNTINLAELVSSMKVPSPQSDFALTKNNLIDGSITDPQFLHRLTLFAKIQWYRMFLIFRHNIQNGLGRHVEDGTATETISMKRNDFFESTSKVYQEIICSIEFTREGKALFDAETLMPIQRAIVVRLTNLLYGSFVHALADTLVQQRQREEISMEVVNMPIEGLAKIRHVGGWAVRKELERCRRYIKMNMYSSNPATIVRVKECFQQTELLEENVIEQYEILRQSSAFLGTLDVTEDRQYRERGLIHISDKCYLFFRRLEQLRVNLMNVSRLQDSSDKECFVDKTITAINIDDELALLWDDMFMSVSNIEQDLVIELNRNMVTRYMKMASCQFLRDFRRAISLKKCAEHRKKVMEKGHVAAVKRDHVPFNDIVNDLSSGKRTSHCRLFGFIKQNKDDGIRKVYKKRELVALCKAYGINTRARDNMKVLSKALVEKVGSETDGVISQPVHLRQYIRSVTDLENGILLRISLAPVE